MKNQTANDDDTISTKGVFFTVGSIAAGVILFAGIIQVKSLEEAFFYKEDNRIQSAKNSIYKAECLDLREKQEKLVRNLEEITDNGSLRMKEAYQLGWKDHALYSSGEQIVKGETNVRAQCEAAINHVTHLKREDSTKYVITHFFGGK